MEGRVQTGEERRVENTNARGEKTYRLKLRKPVFEYWKEVVDRAYSDKRGLLESEDDYKKALEFKRSRIAAIHERLNEVNTTKRHPERSEVILSREDVKMIIAIKKDPFKASERMLLSKMREELVSAVPARSPAELLRSVFRRDKK